MSGNSMRKQRQEERNWSPPQIETLTQKQATFLDQLHQRDCVVGVGPAGTGKTYVACAYAGHELFNKNVQRIVLARPTVGVSRTMGFLPGDIKRKMAPWARPLTEVFKRQMSAKKYEECTTQGLIQIESLEHIRGLTFDNAFLVIDEAQNTTPAEMKAVLTRIGEGTRVAILGDVSQSDLDADNGLSWAQRAVERGLVSDVGLIEFTSADVVRSAICRMWGEAFDVLESEQASSEAGLRRVIGR